MRSVKLRFAVIFTDGTFKDGDAERVGKREKDVRHQTPSEVCPGGDQLLICFLFLFFLFLFFLFLVFGGSEEVT